MLRVNVTQKAISSLNYRQFLLEVLNSKETRGGLAHLARRSGLSRSFLSELVQGKKALSLRSFIKLSYGLGFHGDLKTFFTLLVSQEIEEVRKTLPTGVKTMNRLEQLRQRLLQKAEGKSQVGFQGGPALSLDVFCIYAALGPLDSGATLAQIVDRTHFERAQVLRVLKLLCESKVVSKSGEHYVATERTLDLQELGENLGFIQAFSESTLELGKKAQQIAKSPKNLIFFSAVSIDPLKVTEVKDRLRSAILDVLDEFQDDEGLAVKKITLAMY